MAAAPTKSVHQDGAGLAFPDSVPFSTGLNHAPAANTAAVVTLDAYTDGPNILGQINGSYSAAPTSGSLKVEDGAGTTVWGPIAITATGPFEFIFDPPRSGTRNTALIVTLATGGASVSGVLSINAWRQS